MAFLHFDGQIFGIFDDFSKFRIAFGVLHFGKSSNMAKIWGKMMKSLVRLALNPFLHGTSKTRNPGFGYVPDPSLVYMQLVYWYWVSIPNQFFEAEKSGMIYDLLNQTKLILSLSFWHSNKLTERRRRWNFIKPYVEVQKEMPTADGAS